MKKHLLLAMFVAMPLQTMAANDYPTIESVRYVLDCMSELGGETEENLYTCTCRHDHIAANMKFEDFEQATFFERYNKMPGKRGGLVRDSEEGPKLREQLKQVKTDAAANCPVVKHIESNVPDKEAR